MQECKERTKRKQKAKHTLDVVEVSDPPATEAQTIKKKRMHRTMRASDQCKQTFQTKRRADGEESSESSESREHNIKVQVQKKEIKITKKTKN